jgi:hypothetical protein
LCKRIWETKSVTCSCLVGQHIALVPMVANWCAHRFSDEPIPNMSKAVMNKDKLNYLFLTVKQGFQITKGKFIWFPNKRYKIHKNFLNYKNFKLLQWPKEWEFFSFSGEGD